VDVRPLRKDGKHDRVTIYDRNYDREATKKLIELFYASGIVKRILFNDSSIPRVTPADSSHNNHFHVAILDAASNKMVDLPDLIHF
jgi:penicillin-insensitive murein endopeptidase